MSEEYRAIDFVDKYTEALKAEDEYSQADDMLRAAAILTLKAGEMLEDSMPEDDDE